VLGRDGAEWGLMKVACATRCWSASMLLMEPMKYGCAESDEPVEMVDGLCAPSVTESLRKGGVGGIIVLGLLGISWDG